MNKVIISTGGTGGHIYPAMAVAKKLREKGVEVIFVGTDYRMEKDIIPENNFKFIGLPIRPFKNLRAILKLIKSLFICIKIIKREKPDVVIGFGNYITVPMILASILTRTEYYLQEQNVKMGLANKLFYRFSQKIFLSFDETFNSMPLKYNHKLMVTGNPIRKEFYLTDYEKEREDLKLGKNEKMILIIGGSLGARSINQAVISRWEDILKEKDIRIYWGTGKSEFKEINNKIESRKSNDVIRPYFENMAKIMTAADLVICRAGALTISELIELQKPSILIPKFQMENAQILKEVDGAYIFEDDNIDKAMDKMFEIIKDDSKLSKMSSRLRVLKKGNAVDDIIDELDIWRENR